MSDDTKPYLTKPTSQLDLERRAAVGFSTVVNPQLDPNQVNAPYAVEGNETANYKGVDADRMTYASDTEKPLKGDGVEDKVGHAMLDSNFAYGAKLPVESKQTLGSGSSEPHAVVATSGENVGHHLTDTGKLATDAQKSQDKGEPIKAPAMPSGKPPKGSVNKGATAGTEKKDESEGQPNSGDSTPSAPPAPPAS
jgi:hypothetical protein